MVVVVGLAVVVVVVFSVVVVVGLVVVVVVVLAVVVVVGLVVVVVVVLAVVVVVGLVVVVVVLAVVVVVVSLDVAYVSEGGFVVSELANTLSDSNLKILPEIDYEALSLVIMERTITVNSKFLKRPIIYYYTVMIRKIGYFTSFKD